MTVSPHDIRTLLPSSSVVLGPMAGITEAPFRGICKRMGASLTCTEMVSATGLHFNPDSRVARALLTFSPAETPCVVQLFGADPEIMATQARAVVERYGDSVAAIDINMGCPVSKVVAKGEGAALMKTPSLAAQIVSRTAERCGVPVTAKFRSGWTAGEENAVEFARTLESAGAAAVTVHGRTRSQFYRGSADWDIIAAVKQSVSIPVMGSGDVLSAHSVVEMFDRTGVDAVMVARGAQGNPWIFPQARALLDSGVILDPPAATERIDMALEHAAALFELGGEGAVVRMRKHVGWYIAGTPGATRLRERVNEVVTYAALVSLLEEYRAYVAGRRALRSGVV